jgi:hypothetical protein
LLSSLCADLRKAEREQHDRCVHQDADDNSCAKDAPVYSLSGAKKYDCAERDKEQQAGDETWRV